MTREHPTITLFRDEHTRRGGTGQVVILPDSVHTAALAAEALGCEVGAIANTLLLYAGGAPVLILPSGAHRVDTAKAAATLGVDRLKRATPEFVRRHTGQVIGGGRPTGPPAPAPRRRGGRGRGPPRSGAVGRGPGKGGPRGRDRPDPGTRPAHRLARGP